MYVLHLHFYLPFQMSKKKKKTNQKTQIVIKKI